MLDPEHWYIENHVQRLKRWQWQNILIEFKDTIIFHGVERKLVGKNIGHGIVEVTKKPVEIFEYGQEGVLLERGYSAGGYTSSLFEEEDRLRLL